MKSKRPGFFFYTGDWLKNFELQACCLAARGLAIEMLSLMHQSDRRGYLQLNGKPVTADVLARKTGASTDEVSRLLQELTSSGVFCCLDDGTYYSRRMVREAQKSEKCSAAGIRGGGNPKLAKDLTTQGSSSGGEPSEMASSGSSGATFKGVSKGQSKGTPKGVAEGEIEIGFKELLKPTTLSMPKNTRACIELDLDPEKIPAGSTIGDLAPLLVRYAGCGNSPVLNNAASEAMRLKCDQGLTPAEAFVFLCQRINEYQESEQFKSPYRIGWATWLIEARFDHPETWKKPLGKVTEFKSPGGHMIGSGYVPPVYK